MDDAHARSAAKPDWTHRRKVIFCNLRHAMAVIWVCILGTLALAWFGKLEGYAFGILLSTVIITSAEAAMVVGSYVFQAGWENAKFMDLLTALKPGVTIEEKKP